MTSSLAKSHLDYPLNEADSLFKPVQFEVSNTKNWTKAVKSISKNKKAGDHISRLESILSKPRILHTDEDSHALSTNFNEHIMKVGMSRREVEAFDKISSGYRIYRYHIPSAPGLPTGRVTFNVAYAEDHSGAILHSVMEHQ
jgi:hypothetical protein